MERDKVEALEAGCDGYMTKPIIIQELITELRNSKPLAL